MQKVKENMLKIIFNLSNIENTSGDIGCFASIDLLSSEV